MNLYDKLHATEKALARTAKRDQKIYKEVEGWVVEYPEIEKIVDGQMHTFWPWDEHKVSNDVDDLRVNATYAEREAIIYCLLLFTHYELRVGEDYWMQRIGRRFKRPEFQRMATMFSCVELNSHAPFYNQANQVLYLDNEEFYSKWKEDPKLVERMNFIEAMASSKDDLISIAGFTFIEGAVLYSSFAFFKHFQAQECGKDLMKSFCRGINMSVADENTHAVGGAWLFRHLLKERNLTTEEKTLLAELIYDVAKECYQHEAHIVDSIFSFGEIKGITASNLKSFVKHRINLCLNNIGLEDIFKDIEDNFIESWFYENINMLQFHDFFTAGGSEYDSNWSRDAFADGITNASPVQKDIPKPTRDTLDRYVIYGKEGCRFCAEAKDILDKEDIPYNYIDVPSGITLEELKVFLPRVGGTQPIKTLPQVVRIDNDKNLQIGRIIYIGGGNALIDDIANLI